jgi:glutamyl-tRNA synthetase
MAWLGLEADEGPYFQSERGERYREVIASMLNAGTAYPCYASVEELDALREAQRRAGLKPRYDGRWRPERAAGRRQPEGVAPTVRFRNPDHGVVTWDDMVKGRISIANAELDDLVIARSDGSPTYNFCVVVDDLDMRISHVIRGDDHVNNTPRQINILRALGGVEPVYGHLPMIHGPDGQKLSKRHGAVSVIEYHTLGYLPDAVVNYLARLGWSHGDEEIFSREALVAWFDGTCLAHSPAQLDFDKLRWVNQHYMRLAGADNLLENLDARLKTRGLLLQSLCSQATRNALELFRDRVSTLEELCDWFVCLLRDPALDDEGVRQGLARALVPQTAATAEHFVRRLDAIIGSEGSGNGVHETLAQWNAAVAGQILKEVLAAQGAKMPWLAIPLRLWCFGRAQTPAVEAMLALLAPSVVAQRVRAGLARLQAANV